MSQVGSIEQMYQDYKDIAEFRMVYIREAHAADGRRPVGYATEMGIMEHTSLEDRCTTAQKLIDDESLTLPMLIDDMANSVNIAYSAHPDRVFVVRSDGRLAVAADRGPFGFGPGLEATQQWLAGLKESGSEPELTEEQIAAGDTATEARQMQQQEQLAEKTTARIAARIEAITGTWKVIYEHAESAVTAEVVIRHEEGNLIVVWTTSDEFKTADSNFPRAATTATDVQFDGRSLSFSLPVGESEIRFAGEYLDDLVDDSIVGQFGGEAATGKLKWLRK